MAVAAYSRVSSHVYVWTLQPAWEARMSASVSAPPRSHIASLLSGASHGPRFAQLEPYRVMAAPTVALAPATGAARLSRGMTFSLDWPANSSTISLRQDGRAIGAMPVQCP
jgi:hypothetical protein